MKIRELLTVLGVKADTDEVKSFDDAVKDAKSSLGLLVAGATAAVGGMFALAASTAEVADQAAKAAARAGITTEEFQELAFAAAEAGAESAAVEATFKGLGAALKGASTGAAEQVKAFRELGLDFRKVQDGTISQVEALGILADGLSKTTNEVKRNQLATLALGEAGVMLMPALIGGKAGLEALRKEARRTGNVIGNDAARQAETFNDRMFEMQETMRGLKNIIGLALIPVFTDAMVALRDFTEENREFIETDIRAAIDGMTVSLKLLGATLKSADFVVKNTIGTWEPIFAAASLGLVGFAGNKAWKQIAKLFAALTVLAAKFKLEAVKAWIAAQGPLVVLAAKIALVALALEDLYAYFRGGESLIGTLIDKLNGLKDAVAFLATNPFEALERAGAGADFLRRYATDVASGTLGTEQGLVTAGEAARVSRDIRQRFGSSMGDAVARPNTARPLAASRTVSVQQGDINVSGLGLDEDGVRRAISAAQNDQTQMLLDAVEAREL